MRISNSMLRTLTAVRDGDVHKDPDGQYFRNDSYSPSNNPSVVVLKYKTVNRYVKVLLHKGWVQESHTRITITTAGIDILRRFRFAVVR